MRDLSLITYLDDASRCVTGCGVFKEVTGLNAVEVLRQAILAFGTPAPILSDNGSCFVRVRSDTPKGIWTPTVFESEILDRGIQLINSRSYHPQANGKLERFYRTLETEVEWHDSLDDFITYDNKRRLHWSLDIDNRQTPLKAFHDKAAYETIRIDNPNWMEVDIHGWPADKGEGHSFVTIQVSSLQHYFFCKLRSSQTTWLGFASMPSRMPFRGQGFTAGWCILLIPIKSTLQ